MAVSNRYRRMFGEVAQDLGFVTSQQVEAALQLQARRRAAGKEEKLLGQLLLELGFITTVQIQRVVEILFPPAKDVEVG
ncbi:MAG: hypothetical protein ACKVX7_01425 [Planctomycetota bacterium]